MKPIKGEEWIEKKRAHEFWIGAERILAARGFKDENPESPWNDINQRRDFDNTASIIVWGRLSHGSLLVQISTGYEETATVIKATDERALTEVVDKLIDLLTTASVYAKGRS